MAMDKINIRMDLKETG